MRASLAFTHMGVRQEPERRASSDWVVSTTRCDELSDDLCAAKSLWRKSTWLSLPLSASAKFQIGAPSVNNIEFDFTSNLTGYCVYRSSVWFVIQTRLVIRLHDLDMASYDVLVGASSASISSMWRYGERREDTSSWTDTGSLLDAGVSYWIELALPNGSLDPSL